MIVSFTLKHYRSNHIPNMVISFRLLETLKKTVGTKQAGRLVQMTNKYKDGYLAWMSKLRTKTGVYMNVICTVLSQEHILTFSFQYTIDQQILQ